MSETYMVNEIFLSLQGEGVRVGTPNVFVRFTGCNLHCDGTILNQPVCDTEFTSGRRCTLPEIKEWIEKSIEIAGGSNPYWIIFTGGEPSLQVDTDLICYLHGLGYELAIETNGTNPIVSIKDTPDGIDWITLSPKVAEHAIKCKWADELKYVRAFGQGIPKPITRAEHYLVSPSFDGDQIHPETLKWCTKLCLENPPWRLSLQTHKLLRIR